MKPPRANSDDFPIVRELSPRYRQGRLRLVAIPPELPCIAHLGARAERSVAIVAPECQHLAVLGEDDRVTRPRHLPDLSASQAEGGNLKDDWRSRRAIWIDDPTPTVRGEPPDVKLVAAGG